MSRDRPTPDATPLLRSRGISEEFDDKAKRYEDDRLGPWYQAQGRWLLEELGSVAGPVVDVGCGTGWFLRELVRTQSGIRGVGVDLSSGMVEEARRRAAAEGSSSLRFVEADWEGPEVEDRIALHLDAPPELVTCISAFHYFADPSAALARMRRVLAPGGRVFIIERAMDGSTMTKIWDLLHRYVIRDGVEFHDSQGLMEMMETAGFTEVERVDDRRKLLWKGKLYTALTLVSGRAPEGSTASEGSTGHDAFDNDR